MFTLKKLEFNQRDPPGNVMRNTKEHKSEAHVIEKRIKEWKKFEGKKEQE